MAADGAVSSPWFATLVRAALARPGLPLMIFDEAFLDHLTYWAGDCGMTAYCAGVPVLRLTTAQMIALTPLALALMKQAVRAPGVPQ